MHAAFGIGAVTGPFLTSLLITLSLGWKSIFLITGISYIIMSAVYMIVPFRNVQKYLLTWYGLLTRDRQDCFPCLFFQSSFMSELSSAYRTGFLNTLLFFILQKQAGQLPWFPFYGSGCLQAGCTSPLYSGKAGRSSLPFCLL